MKAQAITAYGQPLEAVEKPTRQPEGAEVVVNVKHCGVCHSDVHIHDGYFSLGNDQKLDVTAGRELPFALGHEIVGEVAAKGPDATNVEIGQKVVVFPWIGCGECPTCLRGDEHLCNQGFVLGVGKDGGYADECFVPHERYCLDYEGIPAGQAAAFACSGLTAYSAIKRLGELSDTDDVVIVGAGGVGMMGIAFFKALYGRGPIVVDINDKTLEAAKAAGAKAVYNSTDPNALGELMAATGGGAFGAIDFVGAEASFAFANGCLRKGGHVVIVGLFGGAMGMPIPMLPMRAISISGSFVGSLQEFKEVLELGKKGAVDAIPMQHRPIDQASQSLDDLRTGAVVGRVILDV